MKDERPSHKFITRQLIEKGRSEDKKYGVTDQQGNKFLLRISPMEQSERKKNEYELMRQVAALGVPMCKPLEFGISDEGVYSVQTWIDGVDAEERVQNLTSREQYFYGFEAGKYERKFIKSPLPEKSKSGKSILIVKQITKSRCIRNVRSSTKMDRPLLTTLTRTGTYSRVALEPISTEITILGI